MRKILLYTICFLSYYNVQSQAPRQINYQAVVRNASGQTVAANTPVILRFTIHNVTSTGTSVYTETSNTLIANQFGLVTTQIGANSNLGIVNWGNGTKWLQVEANVANTTFIDMGTTQLVSVPYALYADSATERQTLSINGNSLSISSGNTVTLPSGSSGSGGLGSGYQSLNFGTNSTLYGSFGVGNSFISNLSSDAQGNNIYLAYSFGSNGFSGNTKGFCSFRKDSITGVFYQSGSSSIGDVYGNFVVPIGQFVYYCVKNSGSTHPTFYRFNQDSNLRSPDIMTIVGAYPQSNGGVMFTDGTYLYIYDNSNIFKKYSISGTTLTDNGAYLFTNYSYLNDISSIVFDGANLIVCDDVPPSSYSGSRFSKFDLTGHLINSYFRPVFYNSYTQNLLCPDAFYSNAFAVNLNSSTINKIDFCFSNGHSPYPPGGISLNFTPFTKP
jgi:hypothetical protein